MHRIEDWLVEATPLKAKKLGRLVRQNGTFLRDSIQQINEVSQDFSGEKHCFRLENFKIHNKVLLGTITELFRNEHGIWEE